MNVRECYEQSRANELDNLDGINTFLERHTVQGEKQPQIKFAEDFIGELCQTYKE